MLLTQLLCRLFVHVVRRTSYRKVSRTVSDQAGKCLLEWGERVVDELGTRFKPWFLYLMRSQGKRTTRRFEHFELVGPCGCCTFFVHVPLSSCVWVCTQPSRVFLVHERALAIDNLCVRSGEDRFLWMWRRCFHT